MDAEATNERLEATVRGVVQGVGFRWFIVRRASELRIKGWTANQADGSVRIVAEGPRGALDELEGHLRKGPPGAEIDALDALRTAATGEFSSFKIRSGAHRGD